MENIFPHVHGWKSQKGMKCLDESWTSMNFLDDNYKLMNYLDEKSDKLKCMDGTNSKTIMLDENHIYMDESYKKDEIFGWMWSINDFFGWKFQLVECMDESNSKENYDKWKLLDLHNFLEKKGKRRNSKELHYNVKRWNNNLCKLSHIVNQR